MDTVVQDGEIEQRILWRYQDAKSNKDYVTALERTPDGLWIANFAFGAHGGALKAGTKMSKGPDTYEKARKVFDAMVKERLSKGYVAQGQGEAYVAPAGGRQHSGVQLQLSNPVTAEDTEALIADPRFLAQEKHDGERRGIRRVEAAFDGINRKGQVVGHTVAVAEALAPVPGDFVIDGEIMGDGLRAFDLLEWSAHPKGPDLRDLPCEERIAILGELVSHVSGDAVRYSPPATTEAEKRAMHDRLMADGGEGMVFKLRSAPYVAGRPNSGGNHLKRKFYETLSAVVGACNDQRSVALTLRGPDGAVVEIGNCTIPVNKAVPNPGDVVEIRYLHAHRTGGLAQPIYLGLRTDIDPAECLASQLQYRREARTPSVLAVEPDAASAPAP